MQGNFCMRVKRRALTALSALLLTVCLLLSSCKAGAPVLQETTAPTEYQAQFPASSAIDHCVLEPDDRALLNETDTEAYRTLMDAMLSQRSEVNLTLDAVSPDKLLDLLRESPYYFFVDSAAIDGSTVRFTYAYSAEEQAEMLAFMDEQLMRIANHEAKADDNALDVLLKIYLAVTHEMAYDHDRTDNKMLGSPLFVYPDDEVYKALRDKKSLCYGFAYVMRFALMQRGVDCFCVYGLCTSRGVGHEWILFRYDDEWFHCDPAWDRVDNGYAKLIHFGKTDREREVDSLEMTDFSTCHDPAYGTVSCTDTRFSIFRGMKRFSYVNGHRYYMTDINNRSYLFDSGEFAFVG